MELKSKRVLVVGLGKSGVAAALFVTEKGARVTISDARPEPQLSKQIPKLLDRGVAVETGGHGERTFRDQDLIVISPGVPFDAPQLKQARELGIKVIGEVELACQFLQGQVIAITGSNGKTTTTTLVGEILSKSGRQVQVGGNIGTPVIELVANSTPETLNVLEISSFQLETVETFRAHVGAILNITPDHLDRHGTFANYAAAKARIFENQNSGDFAVLNADNAACLEIGRKVKSKVLWFGTKQRVQEGAFARAGRIYFRQDAQEIEVMSTDEVPLKGAHNVEDVLAAVCCTLALGCTPEQVRQGVMEFKAVEHRLEHVADINGVQFFNDSKATNVDATIKALESFAGNIHVILGGKDKNSDYTQLNELLRARAKHVYTIGAAAEKIESHLGDAAPLSRAKTLDAAVRMAFDNASGGDVVLLAPACSSFDQFESYEHRGRVFKQLVKELASRETVSSGDRRSHG
jgi:UDP-N-acetylmuramoylalanine--D-glutamate ligase